MRYSISSAWALCLSSLAFVDAQSTSATGIRATSVRTTASSLGLQTGAPTSLSAAPSAACSAIRSVVRSARSDVIRVDANTAHDCLLSVPIVKADALTTVDSIIRMLQFQSTLTILKSPPQGYFNPAVDLVGGMNSIKDKINANSYTNEYDFEADVATLLNRAYDGHLGFEGMAFAGALRWRRSSDIALIVASTDGQIPKIYALNDWNTTGFTPSEVSQINGQGVVDFLNKEADLLTYHDPDTRFNSLFQIGAQDSLGSFISPRSYPGANTTITFANGTTKTTLNGATVVSPSAWASVTNGASFYNQLVSINAYTSNKAKRDFEKRDPSKVPERLIMPRHLERRNNPLGYPRPWITHSSDDVPLSGYFMSHAVGQIGILVCGTFNTDTVQDTQEFQRLIQMFITEAQRRQVARLIIDLRGNGGGKIFSGYDAFKQLFPNIEPFGDMRFRAQDSSNIYGSQISTLTYNRSTADLYVSPFNYHSFLDVNLKAYPSWAAMFGPVNAQNDKFTNQLRWNLSDPRQTSDIVYGTGISVTGYLDRANWTMNTAPPFKNDSIVMLNDGICASTCALFVEMMGQQAGVRTVSVGGRPQYGPMQAVGGTKGSQVLQLTYFLSLSDTMTQVFATTQSQANQWANTLPDLPGVYPADASVNFMDNLRRGVDVPTQFVNDTSYCRLFYTPQNQVNVTSMWEAVANAAFGNNGGWDESKCVPGSSRTQQLSNGLPSTTSGVGAAATTTSKGAAPLVVPSLPMGTIAWVGAVTLGSALFGVVLI